MELVEDNWRHIFGYLTSNDLILLKSTNRYLHELISELYGGNLSYNLHEIVYRNYYSLFINYIYKTNMNLKQYSYDLSYCAGLGCSSEFAKWLKTNNLLNKQILLKGALRSGNRNFINYVHTLKIKECTYISILRSMSIPIVEFASELFGIRLNIEFHLGDLLSDRVENIIGFKPNLTSEYIRYLIQNMPKFDQGSLFRYLIRNKISLITELINSGYMPSQKHLQSALYAEKFDITDLIIKVNPECLNMRTYTVCSQLCYEYANSRSIAINGYTSMIQAVKTGNIGFIDYLYQNGVKFSYDMLKYTQSMGIFPFKIDVLIHIANLGYKFPNGIFKFMYDQGISMNIDMFEFLVSQGLYDNIYTQKCMFSGNDVWYMIDKCIELNYEITDSAYERIVVYNDAINIIKHLIKAGRVLPEHICDLSVSHGCSVQVLDYLMGLGYKLSEERILDVVKNEDIEMMEFITSKVEITMETILEISILEDISQETKLDVMRLVVENYAKNSK